MKARAHAGPSAKHVSYGRFRRGIVALVAMLACGFLALTVSEIAEDYRRAIELAAVLFIGLLTYFLLLHLGRLQRVSDELEASELRFRDFASVGSDWYWEQDADLRFVFSSSEISNTSDPRLDHHIGKTVRELLWRGLAEEDLQKHEADLDARRPFRNFRFRANTRSERVKEFSASGKPIFSADGSFLGFRGIARDITEEMAAERERLRAEKKLEVALSNMAQGICLYDAEGRLVLANQKYAEFYDLPAGTVKSGMTLRDILDVMAAANRIVSQDVERVVAGHVTILSDREARAFQHGLRGGEVIEVMQQPLPDGGFVTMYSDITARSQSTAALVSAKTQAETANRAKSEFLANMSHELRTPLNAIIGFSEVIKDGVLGPIGSPKYLQYAGDIHQSGQHLLSIINDILDMSKIEAGRYELQEGTIDLAEVVASCLIMVSGRARDGGIRLESRVAELAVRLHGDHRAVKQVVLNLLSNAVKFTRSDGTVAVDLHLGSSGALALSVADTGIGIAEADLARVFEPFQQVDSSYHRVHDGIGLGLSISKRLMELHGGGLQIESEVDRGTTVTIRFPASRVLPPAPAATSVSALRAGA
ncbi:MAG: PAS-domain containing protein [Proteobacteria bacterium]|nr:PAS-domain containing protein [Pseudomonadota bacterium]